MEQVEREENGKEVSVINQAGKANAHMEIKPNYNKEIRKKIDDVRKRNIFKEEVFAERKTIEDYYTKNLLHKDSQAAKAKYGEKAATKHTSEVDHTIALKTVYDLTKDNAFLSVEDIKQIANQEQNYKVINSKTNRSKGSDSNSEYVKKHKHDLAEAEKRAMKTEERQAATVVMAEMARTTFKNVNKVGIESAKQGMKIGGAVSAVQNIEGVLSGEEEFGEAILQVGLDTVKSGAISYGTGICVRVVEYELEKKAFQTAGEKIITGVSAFVKNGGPAKAIAVITEAGDAVMRYIQGDISAEECVLELGERGTGLAASFAAGGAGVTVGAGMGGMIGGIVGSVLPGLGTTAGVALGVKAGMLAGEIVGNIAGYMIGTEIYRRLEQYIAISFLDPKEMERLERMYNQLAQRIKEERVLLENSLRQVQEEHRYILLRGFEDMRVAILENDINAFNLSLQEICNQFGMDIAFKTRKEFDDFMADKDAVLRFGKC